MSDHEWSTPLGWERASLRTDVDGVEPDCVELSTYVRGEGGAAVEVPRSWLLAAALAVNGITRERIERALIGRTSIDGARVVTDLLGLTEPRP